MGLEFHWDLHGCPLIKWQQGALPATSRTLATTPRYSRFCCASEQIGSLHLTSVAGALQEPPSSIAFASLKDMAYTDLSGRRTCQLLLH